MTIHVMTIAHYYKADKIIKGLSSEKSIKDVIKESSTQLKWGFCKAKYLRDNCPGI